MKTPEDYDAIARLWWEGILKLAWEDTGGESALASFSAGIPLQGQEDELFRLLQEQRADLLGSPPSLDRQGVKNILVGVSADLIERVAIALKPVDIESKWFYGLSYGFFDWTKDRRKSLNNFIKQYGPHMGWIQAQVNQNNSPLPSAIRMELQKSGIALYEAVQLAKAYVRLFDELPTRWEKSGKEYSKITGNPYWNDIIRPTLALIDEALKAPNGWRISASKHRLLADLLHLAYPWAWGRDEHTLRLLRERCDRL